MRDKSLALSRQLLERLRMIYASNLSAVSCAPRCCLVNALALAVGLTASAIPAQADFLVCNDSFDVLNIALARDPGSGFVSEGWWSVAPGRCAALLRGRIDSRYIYLYAIDVFSQPVLEGDVTFCIGEQGFRIPGAQDCWQRGHIAAGFVEIDTGQAEQWITFLDADGQAAGPRDQIEIPAPLD